MTLPKEIRAVIREMVAILNDPDVDEDDRAMALATMDEALFPTHSPFDGRLGVDLADLERHATGEEAAIQETMDREEALFAARVESLLKERGMTQAQLAEAIGVGQPVVSMLLSRACRPQRRTVERMARALGVEASTLWPDLPEAR